MAQTPPPVLMSPPATAPEPAVNILEIVSVPATPSALHPLPSPAASSSAPPPPAPVVRQLPAVTLPFYSSIALFAPPGAALPSASVTAAPFVKPPPAPVRRFFDARAGHKRKQHSTVPSPSTSFRLPTYRRTLPQAGLTAALEAACASLSPSPSVASAAAAVLSLLSLLSRATDRSYDLSLRRLTAAAPSDLAELLQTHPVLPLLTAPLLFSLGWERRGDEFSLVDDGSRVKRRMTAVRLELQQLQQDATVADSTGVFQVMQADRPNADVEEADADDGGAEDDGEDESAEEEAKYADSSLTNDIVRLRPSTIHAHTHRVRQMPRPPTLAQHSRYTFRASQADAAPTRPAAARARPTSAAAADGLKPRLPRTKALLSNVAGDRRTMQITLPVSFLAAAPSMPSALPAAGKSAGHGFTVQPAFLDLGLLLLHRSYGASLLLSNTSARYARFNLQPTPEQTPSAALSVSLHYRHGGIAAGLHKRVQLLVRAEAVGRYEGEVVVQGDCGQTASLQLTAEVMEAEGEWRREAQGRASLSAGALGLTLTSSLPGSLKQVTTDLGRVHEISALPTPREGEEERKEQLLHARILCNWKRSRPAAPL